MLPTPLRLRPARRLLAALATLCVLLSTLGWAHPACALPPTHEGAAAAPRSGGAPPVHDGIPCHTDTQDPSTGRPDGDQRGATGAVPCTLATQCITVVVVTAGVIATALPPTSLRPAALRQALPPEPAGQPDSPPPKR